MKILFVHQGFELYGSDRCFIDCVRATKEAYKGAEVTAFIPQAGEIMRPLSATGANVAVKPLWILRRASIVKLITYELLRLPLALFRAYQQFKAHDIIYINTLVVLDYLIISHFFPKKAIVHVHEVPAGKLVKIFQALLKWSRATVIFNSQATKASYPLLLSQQSHVIYNGIAASDAPSHRVYDGSQPLQLLLLSRINRMKGQDIAIEAIRLLPPALRAKVHLHIVGGVFGEDKSRLHALEKMVWDNKLQAQVTFTDFVAHPRQLIRDSDIILMPSTEFESLGRVAIEAMAEGRTAIVSNIGGLVETVEHGVSGWHVAANNAESLKNTLAKALLSPQLWGNFGKAGLFRFNNVFSMTTIDKQIAQVIKPQ